MKKEGWLFDGIRRQVKDNDFHDEWMSHVRHFRNDIRGLREIETNEAGKEKIDKALSGFVRFSTFCEVITSELEFINEYQTYKARCKDSDFETILKCLIVAIKHKRYDLLKTIVDLYED